MGHLLSSAIKMQKAAATTTTTTTSATITVSWFYDGVGCTTSSYSFRKNGSTQASGGGAGSASGSFTCIVGDVLVAENTSGIKGFACGSAAAQIDRNGVTVASDFQSGFSVTATATWTVTAGTTSVQLYAGLAA